MRINEDCPENQTMAEPAEKADCTCRIADCALSRRPLFMGEMQTVNFKGVGKIKLDKPEFCWTISPDVETSDATLNKNSCDHIRFS